jgi:tRNA (guanine37-N1)-methyltransferase
MKIDIITLFPNMFTGFINESIIGRAIKDNKVEINLINLRDFTKEKHGHVDDTPFGGGAGMVLMCQPVFDCIKSVRTPDSLVIMMTPQGKQYSQGIAKELVLKDHLILLCGHYEGFDERIRSIVDMELSIGDYVLTGGEIPAMAITDSIVRLIDGVIEDDSHEYDSYSNWMLEHPQYTKPRSYEGMEVPEVLCNGNHKEIEKYKLKESLRRTYLRRPDLLEKHELSKEEQILLDEIIKEEKC